MSEPGSGSAVRAGLLTLWGLATLILVACIALLLYSRVQRGDTPLELTLERTPPRAASVLPAEEPRETRGVHIYYADPQGMRLEPQLRRVPYGEDTVANCRRALDLLIEGPQDELTPVVPPSTKVRGLYMVDEGELVVDFSRDLEAGQVKTASAEWLMVRAVVATLVQPRLRAPEDPPIRRVRFLFEGSPPQDMFPAHIDLSEPVAFDKTWIAPRDAGNADV